MNPAVPPNPPGNIVLLSRPLIAAIRAQYRLNWLGLHGPRHWARVLQNGLVLAPATGARVDIVTLFAVFHDACRHNEDHDPKHGARGADLAAAFRSIHFDLDPAGLDLLQTACRTHTTGRQHPDVTVRTCWDADRLDLWRVGTRPDPRYLTTEPARHPGMIEEAVLRCEQDEFPHRPLFMET
jgi:uncharacterized protein